MALAPAGYAQLIGEQAGPSVVSPVLERNRPAFALWPRAFAVCLAPLRPALWQSAPSLRPGAMAWKLACGHRAP